MVTAAYSAAGTKLRRHPWRLCCQTTVVVRLPRRILGPSHPDHDPRDPSATVQNRSATAPRADPHVGVSSQSGGGRHVEPATYNPEPRPPLQSQPPPSSVQSQRSASVAPANRLPHDRPAPASYHEQAFAHEAAPPAPPPVPFYIPFVTARQEQEAQSEFGGPAGTVDRL